MNTPITTTRQTPVLTVVIAAVAVAALVVAGLALVRTSAGDEEALPDGYEALVWDCETHHIDVAAADDTVDRESVRRVVAAAQIALSPAPVRVYTSEAVEEADVVVSTLDDLGSTVHMRSPVEQHQPITVSMGENVQTEQMIQSLRRILTDDLCVSTFVPERG